MYFLVIFWDKISNYNHLICLIVDAEKVMRVFVVILNLQFGSRSWGDKELKSQLKFERQVTNIILSKCDVEPF